MAEPDITYQTMTARRATGRKIRALGFRILDETRSVFAPRRTSGRERLPALRDLQAVRRHLTPAERLSFDFHRGFALNHAWIGTPGTWLCWQRKLKGDGIAYHEVLHAGDRAFLSANAQAIADTIVTGDRSILAVDSRWIVEDDDPGTVEQIPLARWFRPSRVAAAEVDHLYSEVILLDQKLP